MPYRIYSDGMAPSIGIFQQNYRYFSLLTHVIRSHFERWKEQTGNSTLSSVAATAATATTRCYWCPQRGIFFSLYLRAKGIITSSTCVIPSPFPSPAPSRQGSRSRWESSGSVAPRYTVGPGCLLFPPCDSTRLGNINAGVRPWECMLAIESSLHTEILHFIWHFSQLRRSFNMLKRCFS